MVSGFRGTWKMAKAEVDGSTLVHLAKKLDYPVEGKLDKLNEVLASIAVSGVPCAEM
jgi:hypothetical protein